MSYRSNNIWNSIPPICKNLLLINFLLWLASVVLERYNVIDLADIFGLHYWASEKFNPIQLITYMFLHGSLSHVFFNMFAVFMFAPIFEQYWGGKRFLIYYLFCGLGAGIVQQIFWTIEFQSLLSSFNEAIASGTAKPLLAHQVELSRYFRYEGLEYFDTDKILGMKTMFLNLPVTVGASGAVFGILLAFGWLFPNQKIYLYFLIPMSARVFVILYGIAELFFGVANFSGDNIAHFAHLGGMLFGFMLLWWWRKKGKMYQR
jgi:membrane associated rhomboid family serine protease